MGLIKNLVDKYKAKQDEKQRIKDADAELRRMAEEEVLQEVIEIKKEKIKQEILAKAKGETKEEGKGMKLLKQLGDEFKQSNLGGDAQMDKLLGKRSNDIPTKGKPQEKDNFSTDRLMNAIGGNSRSVDTSQIAGIKKENKTNLAGTLGGNGPSNEKLRMMAGYKDNTENLKKATRLKK